ncbi:hypothetical protein [Hyalangium versicolor]|uniref:hypothetical protein n=1 Tax=Hyalangium versicolor TaxID=2861190 RepID=UPI001CCCAFB8|nr:hypothetical protein [Hyalangium versicolor]
MRRWFLALLVIVASSALAQAPEAAATPTPEAPKEAPKEAPAPPAEAKPTPSAPAPSAPAPSTPAPSEPAPSAPAPTPKAPPPAPAAPPTPAAKPPAAPPTAPPAAAPLTDDEASRRDNVKTAARYIFENLLNGDVRKVTSELLYPFQLEDKRYNTPEELVAAWVKQLRTKRTDLITLYDIEVLSLAEMEKKYGKPPARLGIGNLREPDIYAAVGNLSGHAAVLLFRASTAAPPKAFAYTD